MTSVIIASYERPRLLKQTIDSLFQHADFLPEVIVVDDFSQNPEVDTYLQALVANGDITYFRYPVRVPIHAIKNKGFLLSQGDYIHFCDNDLYFEPSWDTRMINVLNVLPEVGIVGGLHHPHHQIDRVENGLIYSNDQPGYSMMMRREDFPKIGPWFSEQLAGGEDSNLCRMASQAGFQIVALDPPAILHCGASGTMGNNAADHPQIMAMAAARPEVYVE